MVRRSILSICALTAAGKGATLRRSFAVFALFPVLCLALVPARAAGIVDAAFVAEALKRGAIVWDARDAAAYQRGHIAGAVNVGDALRVLRNPTTEDFIETAHIEAILGGDGIDPAREIVVYSTRGMSAPISRISPSAISAARMSPSTTTASTAGRTTSARSKPARRG